MLRVVLIFIENLENEEIKYRKIKDRKRVGAIKFEKGNCVLLSLKWIRMQKLQLLQEQAFTSEISKILEA